MDLLERFSSFRLWKNRGCKSFIRKHLRGGASAMGYHFFFRRGKPREYLWETERIYCDGEYTIVLTRYPFPFRRYLACLGFDISAHGVVSVVQIQGVRGKQEELRLLRWDRMLLEMLITFARDSGFTEVRVQSSRENRWAKGKNHLRYDVLPKRMGFTMGTTHHVLPLET